MKYGIISKILYLILSFEIVTFCKAYSNVFFYTVKKKIQKKIKSSEIPAWLELIMFEKREFGIWFLQLQNMRFFLNICMDRYGLVQLI